MKTSQNMDFDKACINNVTKEKWEAHCKELSNIQCVI